MIPREPMSTAAPPRRTLSIPCVAAAVLALLCPAPGSAQTTVGAEFQVSTVTAGYQSYPSVARRGNAGFVIVWDSPDGHGRGVFARRYDASGLPGPVFRVNDYTTSYQWRPQVGASDDGSFVVTWQSQGQDGSDYGVFARRYDPSAIPGPEFRVNTYTTGRQRFPSVGMGPSGHFVVAWTGATTGGSYYDVFGRVYDRFGNAQGSEFVVNASTTGEEFNAHVAVNDSGGFVVAWTADDTDASGVFARRFALGGTPLGGDFQMNAYTTGNQYDPAVAFDPFGGFVATWIGRDADRQGVFMRRFDSAGAPFDDDFQVNTYTTDDQGDGASVAVDDAGKFVVAWTSRDGADYEVFARPFDAAGAPLSPEFRLNDYTTDAQRLPSLAAETDGRFVAAWMSDGQDGDGRGVFGKRFHADLIFADGFESGGTSAWSSAATDGGDLAVSGAAALRSSTLGLQGVVDDTAGLFVQDDRPNDDGRYRARFYFDTNGFDPGETQNRRRTRLFIAFEENPTRRLAAIVLRRLGGAYSVMARARLDDNSQHDSGFFPIGAGPHVVELQWVRSSGADADDGGLDLWVDGAHVYSASALDNSLSAVDFVRLGALSVKAGATGTLYWDAFESRRFSFIGF